jgi:hypothetical protein
MPRRINGNAGISGALGGKTAAYAGTAGRQVG